MAWRNHGVLCWSAGVAIFSALAGTAVTAADGPVATLMVLVRSGGADPSAPLVEPEKIDQIRTMITKLPEAPAPNWPSLGFRGFAVAADERKANLPGSIRVFHGVIQITFHGKISYHQDSKGLEDFLRTEASARGLGHFQ